MKNYYDISPAEVISEVNRLVNGKPNPGDGGFSNGTEAMGWSNCNCDNCIRSYLFRNPDKLDAFDISAADKAAMDGIECPGKLAMDYGWIAGAVPAVVIEWMGGANGQIPNECAHFSEDDRDNPENSPDPVDPNQLRLPFLLVELFGIADPDVLVFDKAIIHKDDLVTI